MSILPTSGIRADTLRTPPGRRQTGFTVAEQPDRLSETPTLAALAVDSLLFLQEVEPPQERDARSRRHGAALLNLLAKIQHGLLDGAPTPDVLDELLALSGQPIVAADSKLQEAVAAITLRAHVEIARGVNVTKREQPQ